MDRKLSQDLDMIAAGRGAVREETFAPTVKGKKQGNRLHLYNTPSPKKETAVAKVEEPVVETKPLTPEAVEEAKSILQSRLTPEEYEEYKGTDSWASDIDAILVELGYELPEGMGFE